MTAPDKPPMTLKTLYRELNHWKEVAVATENFELAGKMMCVIDTVKYYLRRKDCGKPKPRKP